MAKQIALHEETGEMWKRRKRKPFLQYARHHWWLYLMIVPGAIYFIIFKYIPIASLVIAFQDYNPWLGIMDSPFVGMKHFETFFMGNDFTRLLVNTLSISLLNLIFYFPMPIIVALLLNEIKNYYYKSTIQTLIYIPYFISMVIVASITYTLLNVNDGAINMIIKQIT